jgi:hypothetical protein
LESAVAVVCAAPVLAQPASSSAATAAAFQMPILVMGMQLLVIL